MDTAGGTHARMRDEVGFRTAADLAGVRGFVQDRAVAAGLAVMRAQLLMLAVSELASNTLEHTAGGGVVRLWAETGAVVCEVMDEQPRGSRTAGTAVMPAADAVRGRGLAIVDRVCDAVSVRGDGAVVQLRMTR